MPEVEWPAVHAHVVEPAALVLPDGHAVQALRVPAAAANVLVGQTAWACACRSTVTIHSRFQTSMRFAQRRCHTRGRERANVREQERLAPDPVPKKPASHAHVDEPATLVLLAGQAVQLEARTLLNVPAGHAVTYPGMPGKVSAKGCACVCLSKPRSVPAHEAPPTL